MKAAARHGPATPIGMRALRDLCVAKGVPFLLALLYRIVDLLPIVADNVAHPDFQGSFSMKAVAPAIAPEITYDDLDIADGGDASAAFYRIVADPALSPEGRHGLRQSLLKYCQRDTLALARVHRWLIQQR